ncbi:phage major capsid family protein [Gordonia sp. NPDC003950]
MTNKTTNAAFSPDQVSTFAAQEILGDSLYLTQTTKGGEILGDVPSLRIPVVNDADAAEFVNEGTAITPEDVGLDEEVIQVRRISRLVKLSDESYGQGNAAGAVADSVKNDLVRRADLALIAQAAPVAPAIAPSVGIVNTPGILDDYEVGADLEPLVQAYADIVENNGAPTGLILSPGAFVHLYGSMKEATGSNKGLLSAATDSPESAILGLPRVVSNAVPAGTGLIIDRTAIVSAYSSVQLATSTDAYFAEVVTAVRALWYVGHKCVRPQKIAKFTIAA